MTGSYTFPFAELQQFPNDFLRRKWKTRLNTIDLLIKHAHIVITIRHEYNINLSNFTTERGLLLAP